MWLSRNMQEVPMCPKCVQGKSKQQGKGEQGGMMKPDIVFFGEGLPDKFHHALEKDKAKVKGAIPLCPSTVIVTVSLYRQICSLLWDLL